MCYSNSLTSKNVDLSKKYKKVIPSDMKEDPLYYASGFSFPEWRVITKDTEIKNMFWGLIPHWFSGANQPEFASKTLNARCETVLKKVSFKHLIGRKHCVVPSTGFFEYHTKGKKKIPYFVYPQQDKLFSMAGIYDEYTDPINGQKKYTFSILTSDANPFMAEIHNSKKRMPIMLTDDKIDGWLEANEKDVELFFKKTSNDLFAAHPVESKLLKAENCYSEKVQKKYISPGFEQGNLF